MAERHAVQRLSQRVRLLARRLTVAIAIAGGAIWVSAALAPAQAGPASLPVHGNWCGPGHGAAALALPAIDPLDDACRRHDACYAQAGYSHCGCDLAFMAELKTIGWRTPPWLAEKARAVHDAIGLTPCAGVDGSIEKQQSVWRDAIGDSFSGRAAPWSIATRLLRLGAETAHRRIAR